MSKLSSQQFMSLTFFVAWTLFFIQVPFGVASLPQRKRAYHKSLNTFEELEKLENIEPKYQKPDYVFIGLKSKLTSGDCKEISRFLYRSNKYLWISVSRLGLVQTDDHGSKNAEQCMKNRDLSFFPYLFKTKEKRLHAKNYYLNAQRILKAQSLPDHFKEIVTAAADGQLSDQKTATFHDLIFLVDHSDSYLILKYESFIDLKQLDSVIRNKMEREKLFSPQFAGPKEAMHVYKFLKALNDAIKVKVTRLILKLFELRKNQENDLHCQMLHKVIMEHKDLANTVWDAAEAQNDESKPENNDFSELRLKQKLRQ